MKDNFENTVISDMIADVTSKMVEEINNQKEEVIKQRIKERLGIELDYEEESKRRFKRFCTVRQGNEETIYFNDGSIDGVRIVTFVTNPQPLSLDKTTIKHEETYY